MGAICYYIFKRIILSRIFKLKDYSGKLSTGDISFEVVSDSKDELGELESAFSTLVLNIKEQALVAEKLSKGDINVDIKPKSEKDILSISLLKVIDSVKSLVIETKAN